MLRGDIRMTQVVGLLDREAQCTLHFSTEGQVTIQARSLRQFKDLPCRQPLREAVSPLCKAAREMP